MSIMIDYGESFPSLYFCRQSVIKKVPPPPLQHTAHFPPLLFLHLIVTTQEVSVRLLVRFAVVKSSSGE